MSVTFPLNVIDGFLEEGQFKFPMNATFLYCIGTRIPQVYPDYHRGYDFTLVPTDQPAHILTDRLHVDTRTQIIRTRSHVTLTWTGYVVDARGMLVNIKDHNIKLESEVHGHFVY